jgi:hypothetical protein
MSNHRRSLCLTSLEARDVPATLVDANVVNYVEADGDVVTVRLTKPVLTAANINQMFEFDVGTVNGDNSVPQQLRRINLKVAAKADGVGIEVTAQPTGDGLVQVGAIDAAGIDLGTVNIQGDLGKLLAGNSSRPGPGLQDLTVDSMGRFGTVTQGGGDLISRVAGSIGSIHVATDLVGVEWHTLQNGSIRLLSVGGNLSGSFESSGPVTRAEIGNDLTGSLRFDSSVASVFIGGSVNAGEILAFGSARSMTIAHDLVGGAADYSGRIFADRDLLHLSIGGNIQGGGGGASGFIRVNGRVQDVLVGGDVVGTAAGGSGQIFIPNRRVDTLTINGSLRGGGGNVSALVEVNAGVRHFKIGGDIVGGAGQGSGQVYVPGRLDDVLLGGSIIGGTAVASGQAAFGPVNGSVTLVHNLDGSPGQGGQLRLDGRVDSVAIGGAMIGGPGEFSALLRVTRARKIEVDGDLKAGDGLGSAQIYVVGGVVDEVYLGGNLIGGAGSNGFGGSFMCAAGVNTLTIVGDLRGGGGPQSGAVYIDQNLRTATIGGDIVGGTALADDANLRFSGGVCVRGRLGQFDLGGSLIGGSAGGFANVLLAGTGAIRGGQDITAVRIHGSMIGNDEPARVVAIGTATRTLGMVAVDGRVENAEILGGYDLNPDSGSLTAVNGDARIDSIAVQGDWIASQVFAGVDRATAQVVENFTPTRYARIDSLTIGGQMIGTAAGSDEFVVTAQYIGSVQVAGRAVGPLHAGPGNDLITGIGTFADVSIREVL